MYVLACMYDHASQGYVINFRLVMMVSCMQTCPYAHLIDNCLPMGEFNVEHDQQTGGAVAAHSSHNQSRATNRGALAYITVFHETVASFCIGMLAHGANRTRSRLSPTSATIGT